MKVPSRSRFTRLAAHTSARRPGATAAHTRRHSSVTAPWPPCAACAAASVSNRVSRSANMRNTGVRTSTTHGRREGHRASVAA